MNLVSILFLWFGLLAPGRDTADLGPAIVAEVHAVAPLFAGDEDRLRTAALLTSIAFRESSLIPGAVGDNGNSHGFFQLWGVPEANHDTRLSVRIAIERIRESMKLCPRGNELCLYAAGPRGLTTAAEKTRRITSDRFNLAKWLVAQWKKDGAKS